MITFIRYLELDNYWLEIYKKNVCCKIPNKKLNIIAKNNNKHNY